MKDGTGYSHDPDYVEGVTLVRRSERGPSCAPGHQTAQDIEAWLLGDASAETDLLDLYESLMWRLAAAGFGIDRSSLHAGTLHPQLCGFSWVWNRFGDYCDEIQVDMATLETEGYRRSPLVAVMERGETLRLRCDMPENRERYPIIADLAEQGIVEYVAMPLQTGGAFVNVITVATSREGGFAPDDAAALKRIQGLLALHVDKHTLHRIAGNVLHTYLGAAAGRQVLEGSITRGSGQAIRAVIWASDLRGFTDLTDRLTGPEVTSLLNAYFGILVDAVQGNGGEVLKFIGDGLLAVFPYDDDAGSNAAAEASLRAAEAAVAALSRLNESPTPEIARIAGWNPLRTGIALHEGDVFFGNVGSLDRLDFTVIGRAVNETSRVEALSKQLGREILVTEPVARRIGLPLDDLGKHVLRGLSAPMALFSPRPEPA